MIDTEYLQAITIEPASMVLRSDRRVTVLERLWRQRRLLWKITMCSLLVSTLLAFLLPTSYESIAHIMISEEMNSSALIIGLLQSRTAQDRLIERFDLRNDYRDSSWKDARKDLTKHAEIDDNGQFGIIAIRVRDHNPKQAAAIVQGYLDELNQLVLQLNSTAAHRARIAIEDRMTEVQSDLESAEKAFSKFSSSNRLVDLDPLGNGMLIVPAEVQEKLTSEEPDPEAQDSVYIDDDDQEASAPGSDPRVSVMFKNILDVQNQLAADETDLAGLKRVYADTSEPVRNAEVEVSVLRQQLQKLVGEANPAMKSNAKSPSISPSLRAMPLLGTQYGELYRTVGMDDAQLGILTQELELAKIAELRDTPSIHVLDPPNVPEGKSWPPRLWIIALTSLGMLLAGVAWILRRDDVYRWN